MLRHLKFSLCLFPFSSCPLSFCLCPSLLALSLSTSHSWYFFIIIISLGFTLPEFVSFSVSSQSLFMIVSILASLGLISVLFSLCFRFLCVSFSHSCSSLFNFFHSGSLRGPPACPDAGCLCPGRPSSLHIAGALWTEAWPQACVRYLPPPGGHALTCTDHLRRAWAQTI